MFHVEISGGLQRARVFNLSREELSSKVIEPWLAGRTVEMGDREWDPRHASLTILEGRRMENADLASGQGWANAERACENATREALAAAPPAREPRAFVIAAEDPEALAAEIVAAHGGRAVSWAEARETLDGRGSEMAAVLLLTRPGG
ncbi:MAG TPA: hypothetical protein VFN82_05330 [Solirubrobacterales bacterium]|jgi:hypothetical protein|nr:hypothetical protein [Solirubrobacterales bacterium]